LDYKKIQEKEKQITRIDGEISGLGKKAKLVGSLQKEIDALVASDKENRKALPATRQDDMLLKGIQMQARDSRVTLTSCGFVEDARGARPGAATDSWQSFEIELEASGRFFDLLAFMNRIAIVNDSAIREGEAVPPEKVLKRKAGTGGKAALPAQVILEEVGRDRFVWFAYKGLTIRYPLGKKDKVGK
jgi:hypothetical protein